MAIWLYRTIRKKARENAAKKAVPTTDESNLVPEIPEGHPNTHQHRHDASQSSRNGDIGGITAEEAARNKEQARKQSIRQWTLLLGLVLPNFLAAMDVTIVAPAIPLISSHFSM